MAGEGERDFARLELKIYFGRIALIFMDLWEPLSSAETKWNIGILSQSRAESVWASKADKAVR